MHNKKSFKTKLTIGLSTLVLILVASGCSSANSSSEDTSGESETVTTDSASGTEESDETAVTTQSTTELSLAGGNDPEDFLMPDVVCMNLQEAQDEIQDRGVFLSRSQDLSGEDRSQLIDSNWIVLEQSPAPGTPIDEGDAVLGVVKIGEPTGGKC